MNQVVIARDDPRTPDVLQLLEKHLAFAREHSPPEDVFALPAEGLVSDDVAFFSARDDGRLLGVGALRWLDEAHAELKSMHTAEAARGRGVGRVLVRHLLDVARERGVTRVSLETGSMLAFAPARQLYASEGFVRCPAFGDYRDSPYSTCMTRDLTA